ncbi:MAG: hypothetical protein DHS20C01_31610 [marine bacterium B5-7]|nr:MAG: hypothetical protein DHS20C01_31610 [marine bacterium B5-7]
MIPIRIFIFSLIAALLLVGCASSSRLDVSQVSLDLSPEAVTNQATSPEGTVNWAGRIVEVRTLNDAVELEVLSFPILSSGQPDTLAASNGRFIAIKDGFVDPLVFDTGRVLSLTGTLDGIRYGQIGEQPFRWPVVRIIEMVPASERQKQRILPYFSIGVGIGL